MIDLKTYNMSMLYQFSEERYSGLRDQDIENQLLLQAGFASTWSFGLGTQKVTALPDLRFELAIPQRYQEPVWLNFNSLLAYDPVKKELCRVSVNDAAATPLLTLEEAPLECRLAPAGRYLALTVKNKEDGQRVDLLLLDLQEAKILQRLEALRKLIPTVRVTRRSTLPGMGRRLCSFPTVTTLSKPIWEKTAGF